MSRRATVLAPAKVNLVLRVLGRRADGYHDIDTLFQAIDLCDEVEVELGGSGVELEVRGAELGPATENLAYRAAARFMEETSAGDVGVRVRLTKRIPVGAGLGGGSSDAAAVLRCLAEMLGGVEPARLRDMGAALGSDVPFFLGTSPLARGRGRGELLEPLPPLHPAHLVLVSPDLHVATGGAYAALAEARGDRPHAGVATPGDALPTAWDAVDSLATNDFEPVVSARHPEIRAALDGLGAAGASLVLMTGSGSTCFGRFPDRGAAEAAADGLRGALGWRCEAVTTLTALPAVRPA